MSKLYQIRHVTRYRYENDITENFMEVRKCPVTRGRQRCMSFDIKVEPKSKLARIEEFTGNIVHHFDIPQPHRQMIVTAESLVEIRDSKAPEIVLDAQSWSQIRELENESDFLDSILPSSIVRETDVLKALFSKTKPKGDEDPYTFLRRINQEISQRFEYVTSSTQVDSPLDEALSKKQGVCQDFAHIFIGLARMAKIPTRYVSGYLFHRQNEEDRSLSDASHAWAEAYLPGHGWVGFDPTNNIRATDRHIVVCVGRDYKDVPPTRGIYRGQCSSELSVAVQVHPADTPPVADQFRRMDESDLKSDVWLKENPWALDAQQQQQQ